MKLGQIRKELHKSKTVNFHEREIRGVADDSRAVSDGYLFIAVSGETQDGHPYAVDAVSNGAAAVVCERKLVLHETIPQIIVQDAREAAALIAAKFNGYPSERLKVTGVTGTNGKTTTSYMLKSIIEAAGKSSGLLGTIQHIVANRHIRAKNTTPSVLDVNKLMAEMCREGQEYAVMEVSSHALMQKRVHGIHFDAAVFTNLTDNEHLDYHKTFAAYRDAKCKLFEPLPETSFAVLNLEDPSSGYIAQRTRAKVVTYGVSREADVRSIVISSSMAGTRFELYTPGGTAEIGASFFGRYNVSNATAAAAAAMCLGFGIDGIKAGLEQYAGTQGRLEVVDCGQDFSVLVDYAHSADALANVLTTLREVVPARIILVFGCGGDRDKGKRPKMGAIAKKYSDYFVITADNSRSERTEDILAQIEAGIGDCNHYLVEPDRTAAIRLAINAARPGDVVLIAGKGHETYQISGNTTIPYDDREQARTALRNLRKLPSEVTVA